jgi:CubicO group peptidase (beta-lactamase class C family)
LLFDRLAAGLGPQPFVTLGVLVQAVEVGIHCPGGEVRGLPSRNQGVTRAPARRRALATLAGFVLLAAEAGIGAAARAGTAGPDSPDSLLARRQRIEQRLVPLLPGGSRAPTWLSLADMMHLLHVPGLSVAVIDHFQIVWTQGYGVARAGTGTPVTPQTRFEAGSVSKAVAAGGALRLVERGQLTLDEDVNRRLKSWQVPENEFTQREKVTLRRILSHTAGTTVHFFPGYAVGEPRPTLVQVLDGRSPANTAPVRVTSVPGTAWHYSGGGACIEQLLMTDVTGEPFPRIMRENVFGPLGMSSSTYEQPLPDSLAPVAASGTEPDGTQVPGRWHVYPEMAAAGLWTTPTDLAKYALEITAAEQGRSTRLLSQAMAHEMLSPQFPRVAEPTWGDKQNPDRMGLGFFLGDSTHALRFGHIGDDKGFSTILIMFGDTGQGAAIMANSELGIVVANFLLHNIAREYGWNFEPPLHKRLLPLLYVVLAVPVALVFAGGLLAIYVTSRARRVVWAFLAACVFIAYAHVIGFLLDSWKQWALHPLASPFGAWMILLPLLTVLAPFGPWFRARRRRGGASAAIARPKHT